MRLRIEWGGGRELRWQGSVAVSDGKLSDHQALGIEADEPGSMWIERDELQIRPTSARAYDGVDFNVVSTAEGMLSVRLAARDTTPLAVDVPLAQLAADVYTAALDGSGNRLLIRRAPGDRLRVKLAKDSVLYGPAEVAEVEVRPHLLPDASAARVRLVAQLFAARSTRDPLWSEERELTLSAEGIAVEPVVLGVKLPEAEGVYDLRISLHRRALPNRIGWKQTVEERKVQMVVLGRERPSAPGATPLPLASEVLIELDPASPPWWDRLGHVPLIPGLRRGPLGSGDAAPWQHPLGSLIQLGPGGREPNVSWEAFPLPIARPGQPHILEVEYPGDVPQTMGISIVEPNATGTVTPIGLDSGVYLPDESAGVASQLAKHRLIFWPRTKAPLLLVSNQRDGARAVFGKVRLLGPKAPPALAREAPRPTFLPPAFGDQPPAGERLMAGYYDRPLFPENFSASEGLDDWSGRGLDDWVTFYEGASRLVEYLQHVGYNGLMLTVLADGSTIYPSAVLEPSPRYDSGVFFANGQDPQRKDVLELLFRMFDREGLQLIPAVQFSAPLPELEAVRRRGGLEARGVQLVAPDGKAWLADHAPRKGLAPYYNPLNGRVQDAMLAVVREVAERYGRHPAFAGLAVQLSADGYAQLPGPDWGFDEETLERFIQDKGLHPLANSSLSAAARAQRVAAEYRTQWLEWRSATLSLFHRRMQAELSAARGGPTRLYLAGATMLDRPEIEQALRPALPRATTVEAVMQSLGIDPKLYQSLPDIVLLRPQHVAPPGALATEAPHLELNQSPELDRAIRGSAQPGCVFYHEPQQLRLPSFDAKSPFKGTKSYLVSQPSPAGAWNRRRFIHALATLDAGALFDGGWLLPLGEEDALADFVAAYRQLPAAAFEPLGGDTQPVSVRTLPTAEGTYLYLVNDSPWRTRVTLEAQAPPGCQLMRFGKMRRLPAFEGTGEAQMWTVELEPFELLAGRFSAGKVRLSNPQVKLEDDAENELYVRIRDLGERVAALQQPAARKMLANPGFELAAAADDPVPGWEVRALPGATAAFDADVKHGGQSALRLASSQATASLASLPIASLESGHLSVLVWLRVEDPAAQPPLRLALSARWKGQDYYRYAPVGAGAATKALSTEWAQYLFQVRDLPTVDLTDLRVRFDLTGPGEVWIDDVELREFSDQEINELKKMITVASYKLESRQVGDCVRLLESYWPRFLLANVPLAQGPVTARPKYVPRKAEAAPAPPPETKTGFLDRVWRAMPSLRR